MVVQVQVEEELGEQEAPEHSEADQTHLMMHEAMVRIGRSQAISGCPWPTYLKGQTLTGQMLTLDTMSLDFRKLKMRKDPCCPVCSDNPTITELIDYEQFCSFEA